MEDIKSRQTVTIDTRKLIKIDSVKNVAGFDESFVSLDTSEGRIVVEGEGLKIMSLNKDNGMIEITGRIDGVYYSGEKERRGVIRKIFG